MEGRGPLRDETEVGTLLRGMNWAGGGRILCGISVARGGEVAHAAHGHEGVPAADSSCG